MKDQDIPAAGARKYNKTFEKLVPADDDVIGMVAYAPCSFASRFKMARPAGFEPATYGLEVRCSILLS